MKRLSSILLGLLFFAGSYLIPALHHATCADDHAASGIDNCAICQITGTPIQSAPVPFAFIATVQQVSKLPLFVQQTTTSSRHTATQPRAPPA